MKKAGTTVATQLDRRALLRFVGAAAAAGCVDALFPGALAALQNPQAQHRVDELFAMVAEN